MYRCIDVKYIGARTLSNKEYIKCIKGNGNFFFTLCSIFT